MLDITVYIAKTVFQKRKCNVFNMLCKKVNTVMLLCLDMSPFLFTSITHTGKILILLIKTGFRLNITV